MQTAAFFKVFTILLICFYRQHVITATPTRSLAPQIRIVNGREANIEDFPYQLSFRRNGIHICGASALDSVWALTAAHCIDGFEKSPILFSLRAGSSARLYGGMLISISSIHKHPSYNAASMNYDIALLRTNKNILSGDFVVPIKLPPADEIIPEDMEAIVSGWGHMSSYENVLSNVLKYTTVYTVDQEECAQDMKMHGEITEAMFCAAARKTDACQGDSGGPIQANGTQIGIVSWGVGCADPFYPGVYTRLAYPPIRRWVTLMAKL